MAPQPQDSPGKYWKALVDVAHDTIAGIEPRVPKSRPSGRRLSEEISKEDVTRKWRESLLRARVSLEPARDGAKTSLILAEEIAHRFEEAIERAVKERGLEDAWRQAIKWGSTWPTPLSDLSAEPTPQEAELRRVFLDIYIGVRHAAKRTADLLATHHQQWWSQVEDGMRTAWLNMLSPDSRLRAAPDVRFRDVVKAAGKAEEWVIVSAEEWGAVSASDADVGAYYTVVEALRVAQGFYTTPSRALDGAYDWQRIEVRHQAPYVVVYDGAITQSTTLAPLWNFLRRVQKKERPQKSPISLEISGGLGQFKFWGSLNFLASDKAGKKLALIIVADEVSGGALDELHTRSNQAFSYLVLPTPPYHQPDRRKYLEDIASFAGATLLPEAGWPLKLRDGNEENGESPWLTITDEPRVQPHHLGKGLQLVLSNRQRTLLIRKYGKADDKQAWQGLQDWPRYSDTAPWQVQVTPILSAGSLESIGREEWQKRATAAVSAAARAEEAGHSGLVAGSGAALVWAQSRLDFGLPDDIDDERLHLIEAGWEALRSALSAPLAAIVSKAGIKVGSEQYRNLVEQIQEADAPVVGYSVDETRSGYDLRIGDISITGHADSARATGLLVLNAAAIARRVLAMRSKGGSDE